jgi:GT2 family glycosyltransferase
MVSVIMCSIDEARYKAAAEMYQRLLAKQHCEMIVMTGAGSIAAAYNLGLAKARGEFIVLAHDDVEIISTDFQKRLTQHLSEFDLIGIAGTDRLMHPQWIGAGPPYIHGQIANPRPDGQFDVSIFGTSGRTVDRIQALDGLFLAMTGKLAKSIRFDEINFDGFHLYDIDYSYSAYLAGYRVAVCNDIHAIHASRGRFKADWARFATRLTQKYPQRFATAPLRKFGASIVTVATRAEISEVMSGVVWAREDSPAPFPAAPRPDVIAGPPTGP